jgi:thiol-disulfide isomerase/thioredoxin
VIGAMGNAQRTRTQNARAKIAAQQARARRAQARRRVLIAGGSVVVVIATVLTFVFISLGSKPSTSGSGSPATGTALPAGVIKNVTSVPASTLDTVGAGSLAGSQLPLSAISDTPLTSGGKPEMLYIGAEYCPYCAAMRWPMAIALSRFGTLSPLHGIHSTPNDTDPSTPTLTFYKSSYTSKYLAFAPVENETITGSLLQAPTSAELAVWNKYDANNYPFIDIGNKYIISGPTYNPAILAGLTWAQVAAALQNPSSPVAQAVDGSANLITAAICKVTSGQPGSVCSSAGVTRAGGSL